MRYVVICWKPREAVEYLSILTDTQSLAGCHPDQPDQKNGFSFEVGYTLSKIGPDNPPPDVPCNCN